MTRPARKSAGRKSTAKATPRKASARKAPAKKAAPRKAAPRKAVRKAPVKAAPRKVSPTPASSNVAPAGSTDLAGGLRAYLGTMDDEVRAVSALSERIDALVTELNDLRDQQAKRLIVLDELRASVSDSTLSSFLNQAIKPRKTRVVEVIPERLL